MNWIWPKQKNIPLIEWIYKSRNIENKEKFLNPKYEDIHDPFLLHDMDKAVKAIAEAIEKKEKIVVHGDFDVDGITSTSIMWLFLHNELNADVLPYIPSRFSEGYGFSEESLNNIIEMGAKLVISVDCGIKDIELVNKYSSQLKFIITDHHNIREVTKQKVEGSKKIEVTSPQSKDAKFKTKFLISSKAEAVVHPMLNDYPFKEICGAVVSWKVCAALNEYLHIGIDMSKYLDLASLGTVCDVMPLIDENRAIVKVGLGKIREGKRVGINELIKITKIDPSRIQSFHLGYILGPRLNASGRLEDAMDAVRLLTTNSHGFARQLAQKLEALNTERRDLTSKYLEIAETSIQKDLNRKLLFVVGDEWPEGILGLIAGKLSGKYNRPVIVGSNKDGVVKASARSIEAFHIAQALKDSSTLLLRHGGHSQAAGLSFEHTNFEKFYEAIASRADELITDSDLDPVFSIDAIAELPDLTEQTVSELSLFEPFGESNLQPLIGIKNIKLKNYNFMGQDKSHVKLTFLNSDEEKVEALGFGMAEKFTREILETNALSSTPLDLAGHLDINEWNGKRTLSFKLEDFKSSED